MDRLEAMRVFVAVADAGGFAPAARQLNLSPPAVTRSIAALEQHLGVRLLHRTTRLVRVTEAGARYLDDCRRILAEVEEAEASVGGAHAEPQGVLGVTAPAMFGPMYVAPLLLDFLAQHPRVRVRSVFVDRVVNLIDEGLDVAVRIARLPDSSLTAVRVGAVRRVVVASPAYLAARGTPRTPADLAEHDAIGFTPAGGAPAPWVFRADERAPPQTVQPRVRLEVNGSEVGIQAALAGFGLTRALSYQVAPHVQAGTLRIVLAEYEPRPIPIHLMYPEGRRAAAKVRAFVAFAAERLRQDPRLALPS